MESERERLEEVDNHQFSYLTIALPISEAR